MSMSTTTAGEKWVMAAASRSDLPLPVDLFGSNYIVAAPIPRCPVTPAPGSVLPEAPDRSGGGCIQTPGPYQRFVDIAAPIPLTSRQKGYLALRNIADPGNLVTIVDISAFTIAANAHTAYGPSWRGFGRNIGDSLLQDATSEFFGTFLVPSLAREDPHYHRMPEAGIPRRVLHAVLRTVIAEHDDGSPMLNYATLLTYPVCTEIANLYVPGIRRNGSSTAARILTGYATDPIDNLITEFLPDVARHIHVHVIFVQRILNQVSSDDSFLQ
jgi:hypothetical protein